MKLSLNSSILFVLAIVSVYVSASVLPENPSISGVISSNEKEHEVLEETPLRVRRACDCRRKSGECVAYGAYQCSSRRAGVVVQCLGYKWVRIGSDCPNSCKILNNQPYCF